MHQQGYNNSIDKQCNKYKIEVIRKEAKSKPCLLSFGLSKLRFRWETQQGCWVSNKHLLINLGGGGGAVLMVRWEASSATF